MISNHTSHPNRLGRGRNWHALFVVGILAISTWAHAASKPTTPNITVPQQWTATDQAINTQSVEDMSHWWQKLGDKTLSTLIERTLKSSPDIRTAQAKLRESQARRRLALANRWPTVTASGSTSYSNSTQNGSAYATDGSYGTHSVSGDVSWDPDVSGAKRSASRAAEADLRATQADLHNTQVSLAAEVALDYVQLRTYEARLEIAKRNEASQSETLQITEWREQAGLVGSVDVEQARSNRDQTRAQIPSLESSITETQHALELLAGVAPGALTTELSATAGIPTPPDAMAIGIPAETLRQRPDVRAAEYRVLAETARVGQQKAARFPSVNLSGSLGLQAITGIVTGGSSLFGSLAASVSQTIFDAGRTRQNIEIQDAVQEQAVVSYESTVLTALKDVESALTALSKSRDRLASLTTATDAARNAAALAQNQYSAGLVDFQTVLTTERTLLTLEDSVASTQADRTTAVVHLYQALGGGWSLSQ